MSRSLPPLNALRAFEAAGRHQSFSRAAEELGVAHSSISRHVRGLEDRLGVGLFQAVSQGVALTEAGRRYMAHITPAFDQIAEATDAISGRPEGLLVVNSEPLFALKWLIGRLSGFKRAHPEVDLQLEATGELVDLARYQADLVIRFFKTHTPEGPADLISDRGMYPFATPQIAATINRPLDILRHPMLQDRGGNTWGAWFDLVGGAPPEALPQLGRRMRASLSIEAAVAGHGVILTSSEIVTGHVARGELVQLFDVPLRLGAYYLLIREDARRMKPVRAFRAWLLAETVELRDAQPGG
ncbi:Glycine cleavage system transcriptional activator GcvA [Candidatus Rhodobacter oscarellae]|uniref:Glycine cleavage system transcriptional activator GcvA n=1 Tax=Candidatus Rhodobacter oscarellae TaxID=1675527 RepID=A0A0J9ECQ2_9RHOB|nr:LysR substrate-binding domain-containing protein [Candidatus Rhodobacter lobularis]KMW60510.1 Glycine cleavage system transcriptional activator GcvA [Candidatus Rhodobacter lobularis]